MTRIVYMGGEQMKIRRVAVLTFLVLAGLCHAGADDPLRSLANGWGKGTIIDFRKTVYKNVPALANKGGHRGGGEMVLGSFGLSGPVGQFDPHANCRFEITPAGDVTVRKFGNSAERLITGQLKLNGVLWSAH